MTTEKSKTEYLKRYLEEGKKKKKPKKIPSNPFVPTVKILDENIDIKAIKFGEVEIEEEEEAPVVAEIIDERPEEVKIKEIYESSKWKRLDSSTNENGEFHSVNSKQAALVSRSRMRHDSDSDNSPPQKSQNTSYQLRHDSGSDLSPPRKSSMVSKERKERHDSDSDCPSLHRNASTSLRKRRYDSDSDISPPRRSHKNEEHKYKRTKETSNHKHKKRISDSDLSPERVWPLQRNVKQEKHSDSDLSPPREREFSRNDKDAKTRPTKTMSGLKAGLQNAATLRKETQDLRERERKQMNEMDEELSGRNAETIVRKSGRKRDFEAENLEKLEKEKKQAELQKKYAQWGKGIEQNESQQQKLSEDLYESTKPLARYHGDEDLEEQLKAQIYDDDPMAEYIKKKKKKEISSAFPEYKGPPPPPNRFGIKPGYRWDGVDRSNGFERKYFEKRNNSKAVQEEAYLWSVQDM